MKYECKISQRMESGVNKYKVKESGDVHEMMSDPILKEIHWRIWYFADKKMREARKDITVKLEIN